MIKIYYDDDANKIFNNSFTEEAKNLRIQEYRDSRNIPFPEKMFYIYMYALEALPKATNKDFCFFDIGAAEGAYSWLTLARTEKADIFCFEPDTLRLKVLKESLIDILNSKAHPENFNVNLYQNIVSNNSNDIVELRHYECEETQGVSDSSSIIKKDRPNKKNVDVPYKSLCLDDFVDKCERVDAVKIDVEGAELLVLEGSIKFLNKFKPIILLEVHSEDRFGNVTIEDVEKILKKCDFKYNFLMIDSHYIPECSNYSEFFLDGSQISPSLSYYYISPER